MRSSREEKVIDETNTGEIITVNHTMPCTQQLSEGHKSLTDTSKGVLYS